MTKLENEISKCFFVDVDFKSESFPFSIDASNRSLIGAFYKTVESTKTILMLFSIQKKINLFLYKITDLIVFLNAVILWSITWITLNLILKNLVLLSMD